MSTPSPITCTFCRQEVHPTTIHYGIGYRTSIHCHDCGILCYSTDMAPGVATQKARTQWSRIQATVNERALFKHVADALFDGPISDIDAWNAAIDAKIEAGELGDALASARVKKLMSNV